MSAVLITGAGSGIGRATALELAGRGHLVFAAGRRRAKLEEVAAAFAPANGSTGRIVPVTLDVRDADSIQEAMAGVTRVVPAGLDVLVNNAGFSLVGPIETLPAQAIRDQYDTNVLGLIEMTRAVLPQMRARRSGRIVNVSSVLGRMSFVGSGAYSSSKFAVESISDSLRMELSPFGIKVVIIQPGFARTDIDNSPQVGEPIPDYTALVKSLGQYTAKQGSAGATPETVAAAVVRGATDRRPRTRYPVPRRWGVVAGTLGALPTRVADRAKLSQL